MSPQRKIDRFQNAGYDWAAAVFDDIWPDGAFKGRLVEKVFDIVWRQVSNWLDEIDARDAKRSTKYG